MPQIATKLVEARQDEHENIKEKKYRNVAKVTKVLVNLSHCIVNGKQCFLSFFYTQQIAEEVITPAAKNKLILSI